MPDWAMFFYIPTFKLFRLLNLSNLGGSDWENRSAKVTPGASRASKPRRVLTQTGLPGKCKVYLVSPGRVPDLSVRVTSTSSEWKCASS